MGSSPEYMKEYREKNKAKILEREASYRNSNKEKMNKNNLEWRTKNPEYNRIKVLKKYGLTVDDYNKMFANQDGCCAICKIHQSEIKTTFSVDHCHQTNKVRGLLCIKCNTAIGSLQDNIELLDKAKQYLINNKE